MWPHVADCRAVESGFGPHGARLPGYALAAILLAAILLAASAHGRCSLLAARCPLPVRQALDEPRISPAESESDTGAGAPSLLGHGACPV